MVQHKMIWSCQRTNRLAISVQAAQHSFNWARVMSNGIALHEIAEHEMAQSRAKQFSVRSNESAPDEMAQYLVKLYSVI